MTDATGSFDFSSRDGARPVRRVTSQTIFGCLSLTFSALVCGWVLAGHRGEPADGGGMPVVAAQPVPASARDARPVDVLATASPLDDRALFDPAPSSGSPPPTLAQSAPLAADLLSASLPAAAVVADQAPATPETVAASADGPSPPAVVPLPVPAPLHFAEDVPLPTPRPPELQASASQPLRAARRPAAQGGRRSVVAVAAPDNRSFFEKLFGAPQEPTGPVLAYAAPEDGLFGGGRTFGSGPTSFDHYTAVYDIAAHTVYMPSGERLEAHSGLGDKLDDPRYVGERMRGPTPPHLYDLTLRESLFHGVQALRLSPVGGGGVFGRTGLLAHTYMLGPNGDSNGCVSFRNYNAFLQAFANGQVKRLAVVARRA